jgi:hypothetical protein
MKQLVLIIFMALAMTSGFAQSTSGTCGENLTWELEEGTLTIRGTGRMTEYRYNNDVPWYPYQYRTDMTRVVVEPGVESICEAAFFGYRYLVSVSIAASVTSIGAKAFGACSDLTDIAVDSNNPSYCSEAGVLFDKSQTTMIQYPAKKAGTSYAIPASVTAIEAEAFYKCQLLESITIPEGVLTIGDVAFTECNSLTAIALPASVTAIGKRAFSECSSLASIAIPASVTDIGEEAFFYCTSLASITLLASVTSIQANTFCRCSSLASITIPESVTTIGGWAFSGCNSLESITLPESVTSIGENTFAGCYSLESITILGAVTSIGYGAFAGCSMVSIELPASLTSIESSVFARCSNLESITLPRSVTSIGDWAFNGCRSLVAITIPRLVTSIGEAAFEGCSSLESITFTLPTLLTSIGRSAFDGCSSLKHIEIPHINSFAKDEGGGFYGCSSLKDVTVNWMNPAVVAGNVVFSSLILSDITLHVPIGTKEIYEADEGWKEFNIVDYPFEGSRHLGVFGAEDALSWELCDGTLTISGTGMMPDFNYYDDSAWYSYLNAIRAVVIVSGVENIGNNAFYDCSSLTSITIPASVTSIGWGAFGYCSSLTSITIPETVTSIGDGAFSGCTSLTAIDVLEDNAVYASEKGVLFNKTKTSLLQYPAGKPDANYTIPASVTEIGDLAFFKCTSLNSITIPNGVIEIGGLAFFICTSLTSVTNLNPTPQTINSSVFEDLPLSNITLYVPAGSVEAYKAASVWQDFGTITEYIPSAINVPSTANALRIYPDPATGSFRIDGLTAPTQVSVTDINGRNVFGKIISVDESIAAGHWPQGVYLVRVNGKNVKVIKN